MSEQADIEEYRLAKESIKRLKDLPHVQKWITDESERQLDEYITSRFNEFIIKYPFVTIDDLNWLRSGNDKRSLVLRVADKGLCGDIHFPICVYTKVERLDDIYRFKLLYNEPYDHEIRLWEFCDELA